MVKSACSAIWRVPCISECQGRNPAHLRGSSIGQELVQVLVWYTLNQPTINQLAGAARTGNLWSHSLLQPCGAAAPAICHQQRHHHHLHLRYRCCPALQGVYRPSQGCNLTCRAGPATPSAEASAGKVGSRALLCRLAAKSLCARDLDSVWSPGAEDRLLLCRARPSSRVSL